MIQNNASKFRIVILASGNGTNAERIMAYFKRSYLAEVVQVLTNNPDAGVLCRASKAGVKTKVLSSNIYTSGPSFLEFLEVAQPDLIVLAGYLQLIPSEVVARYPRSIINIHPSLLPAYGGRGMYGNRIHNAVIANRDAESGITIHYVNENYDQGEIILQVKLDVNHAWTPDELAKAIHQFEYKHLPVVIEKIFLERKKAPMTTNLNGQ